MIDMKLKVNVVIETFDKCTDLRINGSNLKTGKKAVYIINGVKKTYNIYMTNSGASCYLYIKLKGVNHILQNDKMIGQMSPYKLCSQAVNDWYIEMNDK